MTQNRHKYVLRSNWGHFRPTQTSPTVLPSFWTNFGDTKLFLGQFGFILDNHKPDTNSPILGFELFKGQLWAHFRLTQT